MFTEIKESLRQLYLKDARPWLVGFSGGKGDSTAAGFSNSDFPAPPDAR